MRPRVGAHRIMHRPGFGEEFVIPEHVCDQGGDWQDLIIMLCNLDKMWREMEALLEQSDWLLVSDPAIAGRVDWIVQELAGCSSPALGLLPERLRELVYAGPWPQAPRVAVVRTGWGADEPEVPINPEFESGFGLGSGIGRPGAGSRSRVPRPAA